MHKAVRILQDLVRIRSDEKEAGVVSYLAERFSARSIPFSITEVRGAKRPNIIATWGSGEPSLILNGHTDTVSVGNPDDWHQDPFGGKIVNGRMYGRGAADAKGPLAAMIAAYETASEQLVPGHGRLVLMAVAMEETLGAGTEAAVRSGVRAQAAVVGEPTDMEVLTAHKGVYRANIATHGRAAHASRPMEGSNAIVAMSGVIDALEALSARVRSRSDPLVGTASLAITLIRGGIARNVIPPTCTISIDRRFLPHENPDEVRTEIAGTVAATQAQHGNEVSIESVSIAEAAKTPPNEPIVAAALSAREAVLGSASEPKGFPACCDMWHLRNQGGIPTVILGPGSLSEAHAVDESIPVADVERATDVYLRIIRDRLQ